MSLLLAVPIALAQEAEPTVNDSDYNTSVPAEDEAYLDEAEAESTAEPTVDDTDLDTTVPSEDESYLDEPVPGAQERGKDTADTPGPALALGLAALAATALALRRRE